MFGLPFVPPVSDGSGQDRTLLRKASQLLLDAGLVIKDGKRVLPNGEVFTIEFLVDEPSLEPHHAPYIKNLGTLGIEADLAGGRSRAIPRPGRRVRFRHDHRALQHVGDPGRRDAAVLLVAGRRHQGILQPCRHRQSRHRRADRQDHRRRQPRRSDGGMPRLRPGVSRRPLLGPAMVPHQTTRSPIGTCSRTRKSRRAMRKASARRKTGGAILPRSPGPSRRNSR